MSEEWRMKFVLNDNEKDYRHLIPSHFLFLRQLCQISIQSVNNSVNEYLSSLFVTKDLLSEIEFIERLDPLIKQSESNTVLLLNQILLLIRIINDGNGLISSYGTNFEYVFHPEYSGFATTRSIVYDNNCSCVLNRHCTTKAVFIERNSSLMIPIEGLRMGCTPTESLYASTLQCFFNSSCIDLLQQYSNVTSRSPIPLSRTESRFKINLTISELVKELFIENWTTNINYSSYFEHCGSTFCEYSYVQKLNSLYTFTLLLGLHGGLTIVLEWICPKTIKLIYKIDRYRKRRTNVNPNNETIPVQIIDTNPSNPPTE